MQTHTTKLTRTDLEIGGGVEPGDVPEAARMMRTAELRSLGLPFRCDGGEIVEDYSTESTDDLDEDNDDREARIVLFKFGGECMSVGYTRPIDVAISAKFEPWPGRDAVLVTLHDENEDGSWTMRTVGEESPLH
jgi:hypothetical protein